MSEHFSRDRWVQSTERREENSASAAKDINSLIKESVRTSIAFSVQILLH